jgi:hypothetical protein
MCGSNTDKCVDQPEAFKVVFLGQAEFWPEDRNRQQIMDSFGKEDASIIYLISSHFEQNCENGMVPLSFVAKIVLLGDGNVGVIRPRYYCDLSVVDCEMDLFNEKREASLCE